MKKKQLKKAVAAAAAASIDSTLIPSGNYFGTSLVYLYIYSRTSPFSFMKY